jgi:hypothetical protein
METTVKQIDMLLNEADFLYDLCGAETFKGHEIVKKKANIELDRYNLDSIEDFRRLYIDEAENTNETFDRFLNLVERFFDTKVNDMNVCLADGMVLHYDTESELSKQIK